MKNVPTYISNELKTERVELYRRFAIRTDEERLRTDEGRFEDLFYVHHNDKNALQSSAHLGCHFCAIIWNALFGPSSSDALSGPLSFARGEIFLHREGREKGAVLEELELEWANRRQFFWVECENRREILNSADYPGEM